MNKSLILLIISNMPWWQKVSFVPQAETRTGQTKGGAAWLRLIPCVRSPVSSWPTVRPFCFSSDYRL